MCVLGKGEEWANLGDFVEDLMTTSQWGKRIEENRNSWVKFLGQASPILDKEIAKKKERIEENRGKREKTARGMKYLI